MTPPPSWASLVERLGFAPTDKLLLINCDDLGMCHAENLGSFDALTDGVATSGTVMMPCPWVPEVVEWKKQHPEADLGVHLTLTSEWTSYRWGPLLGGLCPSLLDKQGCLQRDCAPLWEKADPDEVYRECRAQIDAAIAQGLDPTHLDSHMGSLLLSRKLWRIYLRLAQEYRLPARLAGPELYAGLGMSGVREEFAKAGVLGPDVLSFWPLVPMQGPDDPATVPAYYERFLRALKPGTVTELYCHCGRDDAELQAVTAMHALRQADRDWPLSPTTRTLLNDLGLKLIGYRALRELQRNG